MANDTKSLTLRIKGDTENARREFNALLKDLKKTDDGVLGIGKNVKALGAILSGVGIGAIFGTIAAGTRAMLREASEAERVEGRLVAVLKATGREADFSAEKLLKLGDSLAETTRFTDEEAKAAIATLLTFTNISGSAFDKTLRVAADLATVMETDLRSAAESLGKVMANPEQGFGRLGRKVQDLTDEQKDLIKEMARTGDAAGAQAFILRELEQRIGGAGAGENTGLFKATNDVSKAWDDMLEAFGRTPNARGGAIATLNAITFYLKAMEGQAIESREEFERTIGLRGSRPLTPEQGGRSPATVGRLDTTGLPPIRIKTEDQIKASEDFKKALADLEKRIELLGQEKAAEQILFELQKGRYKNLQQSEQDALLVAAQRFDAAKARQDSDKEALDDLNVQIKAEEDYNAELEKSAEALRDVINPARALFVEMTKINDLFARGKITADEFIDGTLEVQGRLNELGQDTKKTTNEMTEFAKEAARGMQSAFAEEFFDIFEGKVDNLGESFVRLLHRMAAELASSELMKFLTGDFGKTGQVGGFLGTLFASTAHTGGVIGSGLPGRHVSALAFAGAQYLHGGGVAGFPGLRPDEVPTIMKRGEVALTPEQMRGGAPGAVKVQIENKGTPQEVSDSQVSIDPDGMVVNIVLKDVARGGPISGGLARAFNLRRS